MSHLADKDFESKYSNRCRSDAPDPTMRYPSPRFNRYGILALLLLLCVGTFYVRHHDPKSARPKVDVRHMTKHAKHLPPLRTPQEEEEAALEKSVLNGPLGAYNAHRPPQFTDMVLVQSLDPALFPLPIDSVSRDESGLQKGSKRLIIVGDVHGMRTSLEQLLEKAEFDKGTDHLILAGDMISKGIDSPGVLDLAMDIGASAVRGNHEDRVLVAYKGFSRNQVGMDVTPRRSDAGINPERDARLTDLPYFSHRDEWKDYLLARQLKPKQIEWLQKLPIILNVGALRGMGQVIVVHAGLIPGVALDKQDPYYVMNMRTIDLKTHIPSSRRDGTVWTKLWNRYQSSLPVHQRSTVIYGHDSKRGLAIGNYSKGLDTNCRSGGALTALIIEPSPEGEEVAQRIISVRCEVQSI